MVALSTEESIQETIRKVKNLFSREQIDEGLHIIEERTKELEEEDKYIESLIIWRFLSDSAESMGEEDLFAYANAKLITRYIFIEELEKARELVDKTSTISEENFFLNAARNLFHRRNKDLNKREIIKISKRDVFGDFVDILAAPNIEFDSLTQIKKYIVEGLDEGTYLLSVFNHNIEKSENLELTTEKNQEFQVLSIDERVRLG